MHLNKTVFQRLKINIKFYLETLKKRRNIALRKPVL